MFPRFVVVLAGAFGFLGTAAAQAQIKIILPPIPAKVAFIPVDTIIPRAAKPKIASDPSLVISNEPIKVTGPKAKYEPDGDVVYHGASLPDTWNQNGLSRRIQEYNAAAGKPISVVTWFASAYEKGRMTSWRQNYSYSLQRVRGLGAASLIKFSTQDYAYDQTHKMAGLKDIAAGTWDEYFAEAAHTVRDFKYPVFISIDHEMNGNWYPYSQAYPGSTTTAADFREAWKHIVDIFRREGADNAAFVWSPNVPDVGEIPYTDYYPGDKYVDWVGISFYSGNNMNAMDEIYQQLAPRKPFFITEWATATEKNKYNHVFPGEVEWVRQFFASLEKRYSRVKAISWFNWENGDGDYRLTRVPEQAKAYAEDIANPRYLSKPGDKFVGASGPQETTVDVVPREIVLQDPAKPVAPKLVVTRTIVPRVTVTPTVSAGVETVKTETIRSEVVKVVR